MSNPLLQSQLLPPFSHIEPQHVEPAVRELIDRNRQMIGDLLSAAQGQYNWGNLLQPLEELDDALAQCWSPVSHLNSVMNNSAIRAAYNACLPLLSEYNTWRGQHSELYQAYSQIAAGQEYSVLTDAQRKTIDNALRDFRLAGVALPEADQQVYGEIQLRLAKLSSTFSDNVLDATHAWSKQVTAAELAGLSDSGLASARQAAEQAGLEGYLITLDAPSVLRVLSFCDSAALREEVYAANVTRASALGPQADTWDNTAIITDILDLRLQLAQLLGFDTYAELSLATKMAATPAKVIDFLNELAGRALPQAHKEWRELQEFVSREYQETQINPWDVSYYSEKLRQQRYRISEEEIRLYLPVDRALTGLFELVQRLYDISVKEVFEFDSYHPDLRLFELHRHECLIARFYLDLYARPDKRGGAWMGDCRVRRNTARGLQLPVAYLVCNFTPPVDTRPAMLSKTELTTLFHEFGHGLHHMLTRQEVAAVSGISGVAWDAVELPSQFLENWCWQEEALAFISGHYETGAPLPPELLTNILAAKNFQSAMGMLRQIEFSLFDFRLHLEWGQPGSLSVQALLDAVRQQVAIVEPPDYNRFQNSFSHIFAGGYAAGYYSYKWAEVLSADAFSKFEEEGIFNPETGAAFRTHILETGGSRDAMDLFIAFRGREPALEPLLRHSGIAS